MKTTEILSSDTIGRFDDIALPLADAYKAAFAGTPWYEVSKCDNEDCEYAFSDQKVGCKCPECSNTFVEAYDKDELVLGWRSMIMEEDAFFEVDYLNGIPFRATIARPTDPAELFKRKYANVAPMESWLDEQLPRDIVYIEDTFANRNIVPSGNLKDRGKTLGNIGLRYSGLIVVTRTINPAVITATARDAGRASGLSLGSKRIGEDCRYSLERYPDVPDERTIVRINTKELV